MPLGAVELPSALHLGNENRSHAPQLLLLLGLLSCIKGGLMPVLHQSVVVLMHDRTGSRMYWLLLLMSHVRPVLLEGGNPPMRLLLQVVHVRMRMLLLMVLIL